MITALIIVRLYGYLWISLPINAVKIGITYILGACLLCVSLLLEYLRAELTITDRSSPVLEFFVVMILWFNLIILLFEPN